MQIGQTVKIQKLDILKNIKIKIYLLCLVIIAINKLNYSMRSIINYLQNFLLTIV